MEEAAVEEAAEAAVERKVDCFRPRPGLAATPIRRTRPGRDSRSMRLLPRFRASSCPHPHAVLPRTALFHVPVLEVWRNRVKTATIRPESAGIGRGPTVP